MFLEKGVYSVFVISSLVIEFSSDSYSLIIILMINKEQSDHLMKARISRFSTKVSFSFLS